MQVLVLTVLMYLLGLVGGVERGIALWFPAGSGIDVGLPLVSGCAPFFVCGLSYNATYNIYIQIGRYFRLLPLVALNTVVGCGIVAYVA